MKDRSKPREEWTEEEEIAYYRAIEPGRQRVHAIMGSIQDDAIQRHRHRPAVPWWRRWLSKLRPAKKP